MHVFGKFADLQLDIIGIVAILGEGSTSRNAQASALSWYHILPRLYPAPQALLKNHQEKRLPVDLGVVVGALSGRIRNELNFFTQLLHNTELDNYSVELLEVSRKPGQGVPDFKVKKFGHLAMLSILGCCMSATLLGLSIWQGDGPALLATVLLSATSSLVGLASWCVLDSIKEMPNPDRKDKTPLGDVVIFYPRTGAFRIVHCTDEISRLYFKVENCQHYFGDNMYRAVALFSTVLLMGGLIMLSNAQPIMQMAFAASYIVLNALYWMSSALNPMKRVWEHNFEVKQLGIATRNQGSSTGSGVPHKDPSGTGASTASPTTKAIVPSPVSHQYYPNGVWQPSWEKRHGNRVPTSLSILRPEEQIDDVENTWSRLHRQAVRFRNFAFNTRDAINSPTSPGIQNYTLAAGVQQSTPLILTSKKKQEPNLTSALWTVIALTGSARWARSTNIAPNNAAWDEWLKKAEEKATARWSDRRQVWVPPCNTYHDNGMIWIKLPEWDYQACLSDYFKQQSEATRTHLNMQAAIDEIDQKLDKLRSSLNAVIGLRILCTRYRKRKAQAQH